MSPVSNSESRNSGNYKHLDRQSPSRFDHTSPVISSTYSIDPSKTPHHMKNSSYEERYNFAINAGMSPERARLYASYQNSNTYQNTFWDQAKAFFGGKTGYDKQQEILDMEDQNYFNELLNADYNEKYNSAEQVAERQRNAGMNPDLAPGSVEAGQASEVDDEALTRGNALTSLGSSQISGTFASLMEPIEKLMSAAGSVFAMVNGGFDLSNKVFQMDMTELSDLFDFTSKLSDIGGYLPVAGITYDNKNNTFQDKDGHLVSVDNLSDKLFNAFLAEHSGFRHGRTRKIMRNLFNSVTSPSAIEAWTRKRKETVENIAGEAKASAEGSLYTGGYPIYPLFGPPTQDLLNNESFSSVVRKIGDMENYLLNTQYQINKNQYEFYDELSRWQWKDPVSEDGKSVSYGRIKAIQEGMDIENRKLITQAQGYMTQEMNTIVANITADAKDNPFSFLLLMNMLSGSFQSAGMTSPFQPAVDIQKNLLDILNPTNFIGKK